MRYNRTIICFALFLFGCLSTASAQQIIETIAGTALSAGTTGDGGPATAAKLSSNYMIAVDAAGNLYIADNGNSKIRMIDAGTGIISTIAGTGTPGAGVDGVAAITSRLNGPVGVAVDPTGRFVYIGDENTNRVRMVDRTTGLISTIAGTGTPGHSGDGGLATLALIDSPRGVALDASGNVFFSEGGVTTKRVREINVATGNISTIVGDTVAGYTGDGIITTGTELNNPRGVYVDALGNLYIADMTNNRIRAVDPTFTTIATIAGTGATGFFGDGGLAVSAKINAPTDMKLDASNNIFIADVSNFCIRMINGVGNISTIAGIGGSAGTNGDGGVPTSARFEGPVSIAIMPNGNYYISDRTADVIRYVYPNRASTFTGGTHQALVVCENSGATSINSLLAVTDSDLHQTETWSTVYTLHGALGGMPANKVNTGGTITPTGITYTPTIGYSGVDSFIVQVSDGFITINDTIVVTVNPLPVVTPITGALSVVCEGASITLSDLTTGGVWTDPGGHAIVTSGVVMGSSAGVDIISYTVTNSCGPVSVTRTVTVNPLPNAGVITGATSVCVGASIPLTDASTGGAWSSQNTIIATVSGGGDVFGVSGGTTNISYTVGNSCGVANAIYSITVIPTPVAGTITGPSSVCVGATIALTDATTGGVWTELTGNAGVSGLGSVTGMTAGADIISYTYSNACGTAFATHPITINPLANAGAIAGPIAVCVAATITLSDASGAGVWSSGTSTVATINPSGVVTGVSGGADMISYAVTNVCGTVYATYPINVISVPSAGTITGPVAVCVGATIPLSDGIAGGLWSESTGNTSVNSSGVVLGLFSGTDVITYSVSYSCGSASTSYSVTVNPLADPGTIAGPSSVCYGSAITLSDAVVGGVWSASNGRATVAGGLVTSVSAGIDTISYSVTNGCGTQSTTLPVTIDPIITPSVSISAVPGLTSCFGDVVTYSAVPVSGGLTPSYQWKVNGTVVATSSSFSYTPANGDTINCQMTSSAACIAIPVVSSTVNVVVNPLVVPAVSISTGAVGDTVCVGTNTSFTATPVNGGATPAYQWSVNGIVAGLGNPFTYVPASGDVVTTVLTSSHACATPITAASNSVTMTVMTTEIPTISIYATPGNTVCQSTDVTFTALTLYGGVPPFLRWTKNSVNVATGPTYHYTPVNGDVVYCMLQSGSTCLLSSAYDSVFSNSITMDVETSIIPLVTISSVSGNTISKGENNVLVAIVAHPTPSLTYQWEVNGVQIAGATSATFTFNDSVAGTAVVNCIVGSGDACANIGISNLLNLTISAAGVKELASTGSDIKLMPNPNKGSFTIAGTVAADNKEVTIEVLDMVGQVVYKDVAAVDNGALNKQVTLANELANGVYMLHIISGNANEVIRFSLSK